jgi:hypothetical protein
MNPKKCAKSQKLTLNSQNRTLPKIQQFQNRKRVTHYKLQLAIVNCNPGIERKAGGSDSRTELMKRRTGEEKICLMSGEVLMLVESHSRIEFFQAFQTGEGILKAPQIGEIYFKLNEVKRYLKSVFIYLFTLKSGWWFEKHRFRHDF